MTDHTEQVTAAMDAVAQKNQTGGKGTTKVQGGKTYTNVPTRVEIFRKHFGFEYGIDTEVLFPVDGVVMIAKVRDNDGIIGSGHAYANSIAKDKSLEKLETVAIGRALASLGLSGGEYASDAEMDSWQERYEPPPPGLSKEDYAVYVENVRAAEGADYFEKVKEDVRAIWDKLSRYQQDKIKKEIGIRQTHFDNLELETNMQRNIDKDE